ncbi:MAG: DUF2188 domain-containing protein [Planctomycetota bacterium]|jgi:hypothetical protein
MPRSKHVVPTSGGWAVKEIGRPKPLSTHRTKRNAISRAWSVARAARADVVIHGRDGRVLRVDASCRMDERGGNGRSLGAKLRRLAGKAKGLPSDLARNHDRYLHRAAGR